MRDLVFLDRVSARLNLISRGDVVVLRSPDGDALITKRVVAMGGLIARATTGLEFHEAACSWDSGFDTPGEYCNEIQNLRKDFADALVQREWFVDVEDVTCTK